MVDAPLTIRHAILIRKLGLAVGKKLKNAETVDEWNEIFSSFSNLKMNNKQFNYFKSGFRDGIF